MAAPGNTGTASITPAPSAAASAGGSGAAGGLGDEASLRLKYQAMQDARVAEAHADMPAPQSEMKTKPDCGEESYRGSGRLSGKVALITGGDSGIGRAVAIAFAREGADVAIVYAHHDEDATDTGKLVEGAGRRCMLIKSDVGDKAACEEAVARVVSEWGKLDCLINNAGVQYDESALSEAADHLDEVFRVNVFSCFYLTAAADKYLKEGSTVICNTSINAFAGNDHLISYTASKGAMQAFVRSMAKAWVKRGVRVNAVAPGPIWTPFISGTFPAEKNAEFGSANPMGRAGQPVECAGAFVYLASAESSYVTGATIHVDGGQYTSS